MNTITPRGYNPQLEPLFDADFKGLTQIIKSKYDALRPSVHNAWRAATVATSLKSSLLMNDLTSFDKIISSFDCLTALRIKFMAISYFNDIQVCLTLLRGERLEHFNIPLETCDHTKRKAADLLSEPEPKKRKIETVHDELDDIMNAVTQSSDDSFESDFDLSVEENLNNAFLTSLTNNLEIFAEPSDDQSELDFDLNIPVVEQINIRK